MNPLTHIGLDVHKDTIAVAGSIIVFCVDSFEGLVAKVNAQTSEKSAD